MEKNILKSIIQLGETEKVEFKKNFGKEVIETLVAFANTHGGTILLGVTDSGEIIGIETTKESIQNWTNQIKIQTYPSLFPDIEEVTTEQKQAIILHIAEHPIKPVSFKGRYFKRIKNSNHKMNISEIADAHLKTYNNSWDYYEDNSHALSEISLDKVNYFITLANKNNLFIEDDPLTVLRKYELIKKDKITNGCYLLFAEQDSMISDIEIGRFSDATSIKDSVSIRSDLFSEVETVIEFIKKHLSKAYIISGDLQRYEKWDYPLDAIREIVINMVVHRDYMKPSGSIIKIFDNKIEFFNPGALTAGLTIAKLIKGEYVSSIRNKQIASIFKDAGLIEKYGSGIQRIIESFNKYNLPEPEFEEIQHGFKVTIHKTPHKTPHKKTLSDRIIELLEENPAITQKEAAAILDIGFFTMREYFSKLKKAGKIKRIGSRKGGYWRVTS